MTTVPYTELIPGQRYIVSEAGSPDKHLIEGKFELIYPPRYGFSHIYFGDARDLRGPPSPSGILGLQIDVRKPEYEFTLVRTGGRRKSRRGRSKRNQRRRNATRRRNF